MREHPAPRDEMVDGNGGLRPAWRGLIRSVFGIGRNGLAERGRMLDRVVGEESGAAPLSTASTLAERPDGWRCDPIPLVLSGDEFAAIERGLAQRARLLDAVLTDIYGPQALLASGALPPPLVFGNPAFLRPCRTAGETPGPQLRFYAADLIREPGGTWCVLADHATGSDGLANALENRRALGRVLPELFQAAEPRPLRPFLEGWTDALHKLLPPAVSDGEAPGVALLTEGHRDPAWSEHALLSRELSCTLVEGGDLTARGGVLYLKTLHGLSRVGVLVRRHDAATADPLELAPDSRIGVPGLLDAVRAGSVVVVNSLGSDVAQAPALRAYLPALARRLLGQELDLPSVPTMWLGMAEAREEVQRDPRAWTICPAFDRGAPPAGEVAQEPWRFAAVAVVPPSVAPCAGPEGIVPRPVSLRVFLFHDGARWRAMQGGFARVFPAVAAMQEAPSPATLSKDVFVLADEQQEIVGSAAHPAGTPIRRVSGDLPSRVADDFFWLGRYLERLEGAARLLRATIIRVARPAPTPRETADLQVLAACLAGAWLVDSEAMSGLGTAPLAAALLQAAGPEGLLTDLLAQVARLSDVLRDRLSAEMQATIVRALRELETSLGRRPAQPVAHALDELAHALAEMLGFAATVAGLAAENMVRGGGRLFLDLGRRVERAQAIAAAVAEALDQPGAATQPGRVEAGLRLALELCDSTITYRSRYPSGVQPAPALDLVLADRGNPRALAFQLAQARDLLAEIGGDAFSAAVQGLLERVEGMPAEVAHAADQTTAAALLPAELRAVHAALADLADALARRYFAVLPPRSLGVEGGAARLRESA